MQRLKIDVTKIDKSALFTGAKGTYLDITLLDNRDGTDQYGNDGMIVQDIGKDRREAGEKGAILGNWKWLGDKANQQAAPHQQAPARQTAAGGAASTSQGWDDSDDIPF
jgi:hypothetical protein